MPEDPQIRIGHCCPDAPNVDVHVDGAPVLENVAFSDLSDYTPLDAGRHEVTVVPTGGDDPVIEATVELEEETAYTVLATGMLDDIQPSVFEDSPGDVASDKSHVRFIHASPDAPNVSVRVAGGAEVFTDVGFRKASEYTPVDAGKYDLEVMPTGSQDIALALTDISFDGGTAYTAIAVGQAGEGTLDAILAEDSAMQLAADD